MKVLVTGASGFAGRWLGRELESSGHEVVGMPRSSELDITNTAAVRDLVSSIAPDAIAHLAALSYGPDASRSPDRALAVNAGGTWSILAAARLAESPVLVVSSSEVYGSPKPADLPLTEASPLRATQPYGRSKLEQERIAVEASGDNGPRVVIVRPFNHAGPGQRLEFVVPALAGRIIAAVEHSSRTIVAGNVDVRRDFSDVRDVVRAYRLILEHLRVGGTPVADGSAADPPIYNIASGRSVAIRDIAATFATLAGIEVDIEIDPALVRAADPPEIRGDASALGADFGWHPTIPLDATLRDVFEDVMSRRVSHA